MILFHVDDETVYFNNGAVHVAIPPETPTEVLPDYDANVLLNEKNYHGLVVIEEVKTKRGIEYDIDGAHERAVQALKAADENSIRQYVEGQFEDRVKTGRPALAPARNSRVERLVKKYHVDFKTNYGLDVVSIATAQAKLEAQRTNETLLVRLNQTEKVNQELRDQNTALATSILEIKKKLGIA